MIISMGTEKYFDKIQHPFIYDKMFPEGGQRGNLSQHNKGYM